MPCTAVVGPQPETRRSNVLARGLRTPPPATKGNKHCDDANACTTDACESATGNCNHQPLGTGQSCDDGDACTSSETCNGAGTCSGSARSCDDGNGCTNDFCDPYTAACEHNVNRASCDDGDGCTLGETCYLGTCSNDLDLVETISGSTQGYQDGAENSSSVAVRSSQCHAGLCSSMSASASCSSPEMLRRPTS
mgnify:CR=1 FL=1